jgi:Uma2 family endonuclease
LRDEIGLTARRGSRRLSPSQHAKLLDMSALVHIPMTVPEFLDWEERQPLRYEFDGIRPIAMSGGTTAHARIQRNLTIAIGSRLIGKPCEFFGSDLKIEVTGRIRYPDGFVLCSNPTGDITVHHDPIVVFEILSGSTAGTDVITKNREYAATLSVRRYVILAQDSIAGTMFERIGDDWVGHVVDADTILKMPEIDIEVPLVEFYTGVNLMPAGA